MKKVSENKKQYEGAKVYTSLHHKFEIEIRHIIRTIPNYYHLDKFEVETAINNALLYFIRGCKRKGIDTSEFKNYKDYQFIIIKNEVKKANVSRMNVTNSNRLANFKLEEVEEVDVNKDDYNQELFEQIQGLTSLLTPKELKLVNLLIEGYSQKEIAKITNYHPCYVSRLIIKLRKKIFPNLKPIHKYQTITDAWNTKRIAYEKPIVEYDLPDFYAE